MVAFRRRRRQRHVEILGHQTMLVLTSVVGNSRFHGGISIFNELLLSEIRRLGIEMSVVSLHDRRAPDGFSETTFHCASGSKAMFLMKSLGNRHYARDSKILVTHVGVTPISRVLRSVQKSKVHVFLFGVESWRRLPPRTLWGLRGCDSLSAISSFTLGKFHEMNTEFKDLPSSIIRLPARISGQQISRSESKCLQVLIVGRLWGRGMLKGQRNLIRIWPELQKRFPGAKLMIVGGGDGRAELEHLSRELNVNTLICFTGQVTDEELMQMYDASDVFAMPSVGEGFGLVFAEAMAHGLPCIASRSDAGQEVVLDGETGFLVDPHNDTELLEMLTRLLSNRPLREQMGTAAKKRVEQYFSLQAFQNSIHPIVMN